MKRVLKQTASFTSYRPLYRNLSRSLSTNEVARNEVLGNFINFSKQNIQEHQHNDEYQHRILIRNEYLDLKNKLIDFDSNKSKFFHISGQKGVGKSILLQQIVQFARNNDWLVLYLPNAYDLIDDTKALETGTGTAQAIIRSKNTPEMFAQPLISQKILSNVLQSHEIQLKSLPQKLNYSHSLYKRKTNNSVDTSLATIALRGQKDLVHASNALFDLRQELSLVEDMKVLIAIDQFNTLYWPSCYHAKGKQVKMKELLVPETFRCLTDKGEVREKHRLKNGVVIAASTTRLKFLWKRNSEASPFNSFEKLKLGEKMEELEVKKYSEEEFDKVFEERRRVVQQEPKFELDLVEHFSELIEESDERAGKLRSNYALFKALTGRNPEKLEKKIHIF